MRKLPNFYLHRLFEENDLVYAGVTWKKLPKEKLHYRDYYQYVKCPKNEIGFYLDRERTRRILREMDLNKLSEREKQQLKEMKERLGLRDHSVSDE